MLLDQPHSFTNTCAMDSALFALYSLYRTNDHIFDELKNQSIDSPFCSLLTVFLLVDKEGWNAARTHWISINNLIKNSTQNKIDMFSSVDQQVFDFIKEAQRHSSEIICSRHDCAEKIRKLSTTEISIL